MAWTQVPSLTPELRKQFAAIADLLIPAYKDFPKASDLGIETTLLDRVLTARPDLIEPLVRGLKSVLGHDPKASVEHLAKSDPPALDALFTVVPGGYYLNEGVRAQIGYPGLETLTNETPYAPPFYATDGSLDRVLARGPIYVPSPGSDAKGITDPFRLKSP
jgi:hypothetical protein